MKRRRSYYPELAKVLAKSKYKKQRIGGVQPDPPSAAEQATQRAAADAARKALPLLAQSVADLSNSTMVVTNASHASDFLTAEDFFNVDGSPEMRAALLASGLLALDKKDENAQSSPTRGKTPLRKSLSVRASTVIEKFRALKPHTALWPTQQEIVEFMANQERCRTLGSGGGLIASPMGKGKTLAVLAFVLLFLQEQCQREGRPFGKPTLVVVPKTLIQQWRNEIARHFPSGTFSVLVLSEALNVDFNANDVLHKYNIVLTTYPTVVSAYKSLQPGATRHTNYGVLYTLTWERVIADEGHLFSNSDTCRFAAMCALRSHHRWIITGTPVLNDVHNVRAELQFIGVSPNHLPEIGSARNERVSGTIAAVKSNERLRSWHAEQSNFEYLLRIRHVLRHVMLRHRPVHEPFSRKVLIEQFETSAEGDLYRHYEQRFRDTCVKLQERSSRKNRSDRGTDGAADEEEEEEEEEEEAEEEEEGGGDEKKETALELEEGEIAETAAIAPTRQKRPMDMITVDILRLRQTCASPESIGHMDVPAHVLLDAGFDDARCGEINAQARVTAHAPVYHVRQGVPTLAYLSAAVLLTKRSPILPLERQQPNDDIKWLHAQVPPERWNQLVPTRSHAARLTDVLAHLRARILPYFGTKVRMFVRYFKTEVPSTDKYIIFSEWVKVLNNIRRAFEHVGEPCLMLTGGQATGEREATLRRFENDASVRVLLISMNVGSYGLNIPCANHASHTARWWSPHTEDQADARIRRPGQEKQCHFYNIVMAGTVEEDVMRMANEKQYIARLLIEDDDKTLEFISQMQQRFASDTDVPVPAAPSPSMEEHQTTGDPATAFMDALNTLLGVNTSAVPKGLLGPPGSQGASGKNIQGNAISRLVSKVLATSNAT